MFLFVIFVFLKIIRTGTALWEKAFFDQSARVIFDSHLCRPSTTNYAYYNLPEQRVNVRGTKYVRTPFTLSGQDVSS